MNFIRDLACLYMKPIFLRCKSHERHKFPVNVEHYRVWWREWDYSVYEYLEEMLEAKKMVVIYLEKNVWGEKTGVGVL